MILLIIGFPKPSNISANERIPRIPWLTAIKNAKKIYDTYEDPYFVCLLPSQKGAIVAARSGIFNRSLFYQGSKSSIKTRIEGIPNFDLLNQIVPTGNELDFLLFKLFFRRYLKYLLVLRIEVIQMLFGEQFLIIIF